jgi:hypothetical protein
MASLLMMIMVSREMGLLTFILAAGGDQDNHGRKPGRQLRRRYESDLGPWRYPRL